MKNFLSAALIALVVAFSANCSANRYDSDPNFILVNSGHGAKEYLYLPSLEVQEYNPPHYQIAGTLYLTFYYDREDSKSREVVRYNLQTKETFHKDSYGNWKKDNIHDKSSRRAELEGYARKNIANAMFMAI